MAEEYIKLADLETKDQVISVGKDYIPSVEQKIKRTLLEVFKDPKGKSSPDDFDDWDILAEAIFWSVGELINNANKANNRWAILRNALFQRVRKESPEIPDEQLYKDIDYAIQHSQTDYLKKYGLANVDLTGSILKLIETHNTNSFALSEKFNKRIDLTLRIRKRGSLSFLTINVINNSPITEVDKNRVEYNLEKIKEDLINSERNPYDAAAGIYDKPADHAGGGFGAGLRSIVLFLKEGYKPFKVDIMYSKLIQYRSAGYSTIFTVETVLPVEKKQTI